MTRVQVSAILLLALWGVPVLGQDLPRQLVDSLEQQGFEIISKRTTWLGRTYVEVSNGATQRQILIARGSGQILQDNWIAVSPETDEGTKASLEEGHGTAEFEQQNQEEAPLVPPKDVTDRFLREHEGSRRDGDRSDSRREFDRRDDGPRRDAGHGRQN